MVFCYKVGAFFLFCDSSLWNNSKDGIGLTNKKKKNYSNLLFAESKSCRFGLSLNFEYSDYKCMLPLTTEITIETQWTKTNRKWEFSCSSLVIVRNKYFTWLLFKPQHCLRYRKCLKGIYSKHKEEKKIYRFVSKRKKKKTNCFSYFHMLSLNGG